MSTNHNFWKERRPEAVSNRGPSAYQPTALPLGQTGSHARGRCCWSLLYRAVLHSRADSLRSHVILHEWIAFYSAFLNINRSGVHIALTCETVFHLPLWHHMTSWRFPSVMAPRQAKPISSDHFLGLRFSRASLNGQNVSRCCTFRHGRHNYDIIRADVKHFIMDVIVMSYGQMINTVKTSLWCHAIDVIMMSYERMANASPRRYYHVIRADGNRHDVIWCHKGWC